VTGSTPSSAGRVGGRRAVARHRPPTPPRSPRPSSGPVPTGRSTGDGGLPRRGRGRGPGGRRPRGRVPRRTRSLTPTGHSPSPSGRCGSGRARGGGFGGPRVREGVSRRLPRDSAPVRRPPRPGPRRPRIVVIAVSLPTSPRYWLTDRGPRRAAGRGCGGRRVGRPSVFEEYAGHATTPVEKLSVERRNRSVPRRRRPSSSMRTSRRNSSPNWKPVRVRPDRPADRADRPEVVPDGDAEPAEPPGGDARRPNRGRGCGTSPPLHGRPCGRVRTGRSPTRPSRPRRAIRDRVFTPRARREGETGSRLPRVRQPVRRDGPRLRCAVPRGPPPAAGRERTAPLASTPPTTSGPTRSPRARRPSSSSSARVTLGTLTAELAHLTRREAGRDARPEPGRIGRLFGVRAWQGRDEMYRRIQASPLFGPDLGPPYRAARTFWVLPDAARRSTGWWASSPPGRTTCGRGSGRG